MRDEARFVRGGPILTRKGGTSDETHSDPDLARAGSFLVSERFLAEVHGLKHRNVAAELSENEIVFYDAHPAS